MDSVNSVKSEIGQLVKLSIYFLPFHNNFIFLNLFQKRKIFRSTNSCNSKKWLITIFYKHRFTKYNVIAVRISSKNFGMELYFSFTRLVPDLFDLDIGNIDAFRYEVVNGKNKVHSKNDLGK